MGEPLFTLSPAQVDLWVVFPGEAFLTPSARPPAAGDPHSDLPGGGNAPKRVTHLDGRILLRRVLPCYRGSSQWELARTARGRPLLKGPPGEEGPSISLAHTEGCLVLAISGAPAVGVDVERQDRKVRTGRIAARFFAKAEAQDLSDGGEALFFPYWTLKEAAIKARGKGLETLTRAPAFAFWGERPWRIEVSPARGGRSFALLEGPRPYLIGLCGLTKDPSLLVRWRLLTGKTLLGEGPLTPLAGWSCRPLALSRGVCVSPF